MTPLMKLVYDELVLAHPEALSAKEISERLLAKIESGVIPYRPCGTANIGGVLAELQRGRWLAKRRITDPAKRPIHLGWRGFVQPIKTIWRVPPHAMPPAE